MTQNIFESVTIVGAGAIGGWLGARLAAQGVRVSLLARGATLAALQQHGLRLRSGDAEQRQGPQHSGPGESPARSTRCV